MSHPMLRRGRRRRAVAGHDMIFGAGVVNGPLRAEPIGQRSNSIAGASTEQLVEPIAQLVLMVRFCQPWKIELGALGQFGVTGREQDRQRRPHLT